MNNDLKTSCITAIEPQVRHKGRVSIFVDGEFAVGLDEKVAQTLGLSVGQSITAEALQTMTAAEERHQASESAYRLLAFRARSEKEIADRLRQKGYDDSIIVEVTGRLRENGYVDDAAFAASWVSSRGKSRGARLLTQELRQKGVDKETVAETLSEVRSEDDEVQAALQVAVRKVGERPVDQSREAQAKTSAFLQRRGFSWPIVRQVLKTVYRAGAASDFEEENAEDIAP